MTTAEKTESFGFKAEIKQVLNILVHSLYQDREIFLRELVSNASDALTRFHFETLTNKDVLDPDAELAIRVSVEGEDGAKKIIIKDSGIGMTREELMNNLGTIAQSGAREFLSNLDKSNGEAPDINDVIGQFGVGFYSVFMVADEVKVISRSYKPDAEAAAWVSDGGEEYEIMPASKTDRGTEMHITLKADAQEFGDEWKLKQTIKKHSDFVNYPIYVGEVSEDDEDAEEQRVNQQESLWRKAPASVEDKDDYKNFYQQLTLDFGDPLAHIHLHADAPVNVRALLFIPTKREKNMFSPRTEPGLKLYSKNILIQEYCTDLLPKWLEFVDGVVDSEDLPLNVSRETVQNNRLMRHLGETLKNRVLRELRKLAKKNKEKYAEFWKEFGRVFKEGVALDAESKEDLLPFFRYASSKSDGELTSLDAYIEGMGEGQDTIYYVMGDSVSSVANSPHLDMFKARDIEVLYWVDPLDAFAAPALSEYKEKKLQNIDDANLELPESEDENAEDESTQSSVPEADYNRLVTAFVDGLGEKVTEVRASKVLKNSPVRLVAPEGSMGRDRLQRMIGQDYEIPQRILEVNREHPMIVDLAGKLTDDPDSELVKLSVEQLYESALVQEGLHPNPADMLPRIQRLMELAAS